MSIDNKFAKNRSKFRKVYGYGLSRRPNIQSFVDPLTSTTKSFDFQKIIRDHDYFLIIQSQELAIPPSPPVVVAEYLEVTVGPFSSSLYQDITFPTPFSATPYVGFEPSQSQFTGTDGEETPLMAWWITSLGTTGFRANFSSPFTGKITYRGIYSSTPYPVLIERTPDLPGVYASCSAGEVTVGGNSIVSMSWASLPDNPKFLNYNPVGISSDETLNIGQTISAVTTGMAVNQLSSPYSGSIHFIAVTSTSGSYFSPNPDMGVPGP